MPKLSKETRSLYSDDNEQWQSTDLHPSVKQQVKVQLERYVNADLAGDEEWTKASEIPTEREIGWIQDGEVISKDLHVPVAKIDEAYESKEEYLATQYKLMRADGTVPLAYCVDDFRRTGMRGESNDYRIYDEIFIKGLAIARDGLALKIEFSATSIGKTIRWAKSKRLRSGSLVALTPASDKFQTKCVPAIVASRLLENLEVQPPLKPSIYIYVGDVNQLEIDPQQRWLMIECTQGYWEAYRHTLKALQKVRLESFPMQEYLVNLQTKVESPKYRMDAPTMDMRSIAHRDTPALRDMNVLEKWPAFQEVGDVGKDSTKIASDMDNSQIDALRRILTKKLAIIQGPPGTGKTYTSVSAIKILLENMAADAPPIIIAAQTNHAVDQILRHISRFEPEFIRLGGQTTDHDVIKPRTLYELKGTKKPPTSSGTRAAANIRRIVGNELDKVLQPFQSDELISADTFFQNGLLSESQRDSINLMESKWAADNSPNKMNLWCNDRMTKITNLDKIDAYIAQLEEEHENLDEKELEAPDNDDDKFEHLYGRKFEVCPGYRATGRPSYISDEDIKALLSEKQDLKAIPDQYRPEVYDFLRRKLTEKTKERVCEYGYRCKAAATIGKIGRWEMDYEYISSSRVIGLTTTGLSKYRGLLSIFGPKIVLIEEAAETLEPYTVAALFDTLQHLILVGDHQQLRANCSCPNLVDDPVNFDISLFERLVKNEVEFTRLNTQRRMRPEIRRLIKHIYPDLVDHSSVMNRPNVSGTGGSNVWWWHHEDEESTDESKSKQNLTEARMIVEFTKYLVWNNISLTKITILTFYNGQKKLLSSVFHQHELFKGYRVKICTVDSYQGEENDLILLSLVRSNDRENIGFLSSINRACVALSRARIGFYIFGNAKLLNASEDWSMVVAELQAQDAIRRYLPLYCPPHKRMINAKNYTDLEGLNGGCDEPCKKMLKCGHKCPLRCHPGRDCKKEDCEEDCLKPLPCGHECNSGCADLCVCHPCAAESKRKSVLYHFEALRNQTIATSNGLLGDGSATICREGSFRDSHTLQDATPAEVAAQRTRWAEFTKSRLGLTAAARSAGSTGEIKSEENVIQDTRSLILKENSGSIATQTPDASRATDDLITLTEATSLDDTDLIDLQTTANFQGDSLI